MLPSNLNDNNINIEINNDVFNNSITSSYNEAINNEIVKQLTEFGFNFIYSTRIFMYYHPRTIDEALDYLNMENGIIQHHFVQDRENISSEICFLCGESKEIHLGYIPEIRNGVNNETSINKKNSINDISFDENKLEGWKTWKACKLCNESYYFNEINILEPCKHSFCNKCWYIYLSNNIRNKRKYPFKCLKNECYGRISDKFVLNFLKNHKELIRQYGNLIGSKGNDCQICGNYFIPNKENTVSTCNHSFCNNCWYQFLSIKIQENKISFIKCLYYECQEKISDKFIINLLNSNVQLIQKYKTFKLELEIMNDPNKKFCPIPNCISYLELKNENNFEVKCSNGHVYCFKCLGKPHGNSPCKAKLDNSLIVFSKTHFLKRCPNCSIITEKIEGCNHITCSKCSYQWCWLCNGKYNPEHFLEGKCKGYQFFKPKNEEDIKLALEGKIELSLSQRQIDQPYEENLNDNNNINIRDINEDRILFNLPPYRYYRFKWEIFYRCLLLFIYILFGQDLIILNILDKYYNFYSIFLGILFYLPYKIAFIFVFFYLNIITIFFYIIKEGFMNFTSLIYDSLIFMRRYSKFRVIFYKICIIFFELFLYTYFICLKREKTIRIVNPNNGWKDKLILLIYHLNSIMFVVIFFPFQFLFNLFCLLYLFIDNNFKFNEIIDDINLFLNEQTQFYYDLN